MNTHAAETDETDSIDPSVSLWKDEQKLLIDAKCPESLQDNLLTQLDKLSAPSNLEIQNFELLVKNAQTLNEAVQHYTDRMTPLMPSIVLRDDVQRFWQDFTFDQLEPNKLKKALDDLVTKVELSEKEESISSEVQEKIDKEIDPEMETFLPFYFNSKERDTIYTERSKITDPKKLDLYRRKILKARAKREKFVDRKLEDIKTQRAKPDYGRKVLAQLQKKCGDGINNLTQIEEVKAMLTTIEEKEAEVKQQYSIFIDADAQLEQANAEYRAETGQDHPDYLAKIAHKTGISEESIAQAHDEAEESEESVQESYESAEAKIAVVTDLRIEAENAAKYWGDKATDRQHGRRGVGTTLALLEAGAINGYSRETYEKEFGAVRDFPYSRPYQAKTGRKIPQFFYDLPTSADAFTASMASSTAGMLKNARQNFSEKGRAAASLFYNDYYKDRDPNTIAPSIHEFVSTCNAMIRELKAGKKVDLPQTT